MNPDTSTADIYEERIARFVELAENAQEAAGRAARPNLQDTYAKIAEHWLQLARTAQDTVDLNRKLLAQQRELERLRKDRPLH